MKAQFFHVISYLLPKGILAFFVEDGGAVCDLEEVTVSNRQSDFTSMCFKIVPEFFADRDRSLSSGRA